MGFHKELAVNRQHRRRASLYQRRTGIGRNRRYLTVANAVFLQIGKEFVPGFGIFGIFIEPYLVVPQDDAPTPVRTFISAERSLFFGQFNGSADIIQRNFFKQLINVIRRQNIRDIVFGQHIGQPHRADADSAVALVVLLTFQHRNAGKVYRIVQQAYGSFADALQLRIRLDIRQID